jgi:anhydro-N-acetylmuramic acid kinase
MKLVGLMSGTSLDGVDVCLLDVQGDDPAEVHWTLRAFRSHPYSAADRALLRRAIEEGSAPLLCRVHGLLAEGMARVVLELLAGAGVAPGEVAAIGSHGQTVWHEPPRAPGSTGTNARDQGAPVDLLQAPPGRGFTLQLGDPATLAERTGIAVVHDFRSRDVAAGGHGAPLVPWADRVLLSRPGRARVLQNLGGMANLAWIPPRGSAEPLLAFDTGPGVALLDAAVELATAGGRAYDVDGAMARQGRVDERLLERLLADPFFREPPPRSTGREHFGPHLVAAAGPGTGDSRPGSETEGWPDLLATLTALTARSVAEAIRTWVPPRPIDEVVLAGGGASNPALVEALVTLLDPIPVLTGADALGLDPDAKEAAAFALLAWAHLKGISGNVPEVTGAEPQGPGLVHPRWERCRPGGTPSMSRVKPLKEELGRTESKPVPGTGAGQGVVPGPRPIPLPFLLGVSGAGASGDPHPLLHLRGAHGGRQRRIPLPGPYPAGAGALRGGVGSRSPPPHQVPPGLPACPGWSHASGGGELDRLQGHLHGRRDGDGPSLPGLGPAPPGNPAALGVALILAFSEAFLWASTWVLSEPLFLVLTLGAVVAVDRREGGGLPSSGWLIAGGALAILALFTRTAGLPLVAAFGLWLLLRRAWGPAATFAVAGGIPLLIWTLRGRGARADGYLSEFWLMDPYNPEAGTVGVAGLFLRGWENLLLYGGTYIPGGLLGMQGGWVAPVGVVLMGLAVFGWLRRALRGPGVVEILVPFYFVLILLWPAVWSGDRFALPLYPFLLVYAGDSLRGLARPLGAKAPVWAGVAALLLLVLPAGTSWWRAVPTSTSCRTAVSREGPFACYAAPVRELAESARWAGAFLPEDAVVFSRKPRLFYVLSGGIRSLTFPLSDDPVLFFSQVETAGIGYLVLDRTDALAPTYLLPILQARPERFCSVTGWGDPQGSGPNCWGSSPVRWRPRPPLPAGRRRPSASPCATRVRDGDAPARDPLRLVLHSLAGPVPHQLPIDQGHSQSVDQVFHQGAILPGILRPFQQASQEGDGAVGREGPEHP